MQYQIHPVEMDFEYQSAFHGVLPEAYQRLLLDVLRGDTTLFTRSDELEAAWQFITPVLEYWETRKRSRNLIRPGPGGPQRPTSCWPARAFTGAYRRCSDVFVGPPSQSGTCSSRETKVALNSPMKVTITPTKSTPVAACVLR